MEDTVYIYQHLGLGDHVICNGLIREISKTYGTVVLFVKEHNSKSVRFMFRDAQNINIMIADDACAKNFINSNPEKKVIIIGHEYLDRSDTAKKFDRGFYEEAGFDFALRWKGFHVQRDIDQEQILFEKNGIDKDSKYLFVHDDKDLTKGSSINVDKIDKKNRKIVFADSSMTGNIFDYLGIIENAEEIHCIPSCFMFLADSVETKGSLYMHRYTRNYPHYCEPSLKKDWIILK